MAMPFRETEIILTIRPRSLRNFRSREEAIFDFICWHNPPKTKLKEQQTHKTQRSVLAHFISCCPIPMGSVNAEEVKWTEGKKLQGGCGWCAGLESLQHQDSKWQSLTRHNVSFAVPSAVKWDMLLHFFDKFCGTLVPHTHTHNWITLLAQKFAIKIVNGFTQRLKLRFTVSAIYGKCQNQKKKKTVNSLWLMQRNLKGKQS